jgi:hypothetical protein
MAAGDQGERPAGEPREEKLKPSTSPQGILERRGEESNSDQFMVMAGLSLRY